MTIINALIRFVNLHLRDHLFVYPTNDCRRIMEIVHEMAHADAEETAELADELYVGKYHWEDADTVWDLMEGDHGRRFYCKGHTIFVY